VEQYQERVQKYVERTIEREKLEPRPDITAALIRIEKSWNHDDGCHVEEAKSTYEWEINDPEVYDLCPENSATQRGTHAWSSMTSLRRGVDLAVKDEETRAMVATYEDSAPVFWLGGPSTLSPSTTTSTSSSSTSSTSSSSSSSSSTTSSPKGKKRVWNQREDWQPTGVDAASDDMCAYDWIRSRMDGGVSWYYPKGTTQHAPGQFVMEKDMHVRLEPSPMYGNQLPGEANKFGRQGGCR
jgi:hypothetical protein